MRRRLFGPDARLPWPLRVAFFVLSLAALAGVYAATDSEGAQVLALFALVVGVHRLLLDRFGVRGGYVEALPQRNIPLDVLGVSVAFIVGWGAVVLLFAPDLGVGPWFWWWVVMWPWLEVLALLAERRFQQDGGAEAWRRARPVRDTATAGLVTVPLVAAIMLLQGSSAGAALATGVGCGVTVFLITGAITWSMHPSRAANESDSATHAP